MTDKQIIRCLGGNEALAIKLGEGLTHQVVSNWGRRGIPWKWRAKVQGIARKNKIEVPADFLLTKGL